MSRINGKVVRLVKHAVGTAALPFPNPPLRNGDVALRPWSESDIPVACTWARDSEILRYTGISPLTSEASLADRLATMEYERRTGRAIYLVIAHSATGAVLGSCDIRLVRYPDVGEIGYIVDPSARRQGVGGSAVRLLVDWAFDSLRLEAVHATVDPANVPSVRLLRQLGFESREDGGKLLMRLERSQAALPTVPRPATRCRRRPSATRTIAIAVGTRPNFVKMASVVAGLEARTELAPVVVHSGQHYDAMLSDAILRDLDFRAPDRFLGVGSGSHAEQTGRALMAFERYLDAERPVAVVVAGDVNSTLACSLAAAKLRIPVAHVESGLRSGDWTMPEEINRVLTDRLSGLLFTHSEEADANLIAEGIDPARIHFVGNTMIDPLRRLEPEARRRAVWDAYGLREGGYAVVTLHRPSIVDDPERLKAIVGELDRLGRDVPVIFPVHPRTRARLTDVPFSAGLHLIDPLGYIDFLSLECGAAVIVTDSGGIQEEAAALGVRCYTFRPNTERPVTISHGTNVLLGDDPAALQRVDPASRPRVRSEIPRWDGRAGERIADVLAREYGVEGLRLVVSA
jgi:UDP-N-acetylglucosamine 2-epimerase (non-hydrolysing)